MKIVNKKIKNSAILVILLILVPVIVSAQPFSDALEKINNFFEKEQYEPYAKAIDFFFFLLLFTSIYLIGVRYAFKEVNKPEKLIAIVLGLMSALLMTSQGYSLTSLIPYLSWLFYLLLFILFWLLFKGVKSKFLRFIVALLLTLIVIAFFEGLFDSLANTEIELT